MSPALKPAVRVHRQIAEVERASWDACAPIGVGYNPFVSFDFLDALEQSGSACDAAGWAPHHLTVEDEAGRVAAAMPLYLKSHSQGEYVFDWSWADAYERAGGRYYPKLQCASPFSPVTGPRLLVRPDIDPIEGRQTLLGGALTLCQRLGASGLHVTFPAREDWRFLGDAGLLPRQDQQYHWFNNGYATFDDFLAALSSGRRKTIRRERREAQAAVDEIVALTGAELTPAHWDAFFDFYQDTGGRKWGQPYLTRAFFTQLHERMADRVLLILARKAGRWVAGALNLIGGDCLYGRHWGCVEDVPFLHFELCYYQAIEHGIRLGLPRVEAGAQGQHKIARGYLPAEVYSAHWIADPGLREPVRRYLDQERLAVRQEMDWLAEEFSPFRQG
ncbi:GNAT family N-acetyltransferase [Caulobacter mirabilis]|uniref:GNAT family N-acetyltransferase n=1 Tax=Caulobacter mirabilis TaxID=69666 RepID=A0A2D2AX90_9CAUL|nr:GNAT family N-acetyltransferase [Caulobacter mirabilis]ATQ42640.1 GNAT family N-acetyltransferase [Caulobacter mirabilis]